MSTPPAPTFDRAGKYRLGVLLGEGGMAQVYRGAIVSAEGFEREVAIKRVLGEWSANPSFVEMFRNEAWLASLLHHDNIVAVLDFDRDLEARVFQVLEYVRGRDLEKLVGTGPVPMPVAAYIMGEVLRGLDHAHRAKNPTTDRPLGIVHRDCTPSNVLMTYEGRVKLSDFGVAKAVLSTQATQSGLPKGKPAYMSPEQLEGALDLDGRSDLFAVGVMFWELLAHRRLFLGDTHHQVMSKVLLYGREMEPLPALGADDAPAGLVSLITSLLAPKRAQRPADGATALAQLRPWIPADGAEQLAALLASRFPGESSQTASQLATVHGSFGPAGTPIIGQNTTASTAGELAKLRRTERVPRWPMAVTAAGVAIVGLGVTLAITLGGGPGDRAASVPNAATDATPQPADQEVATSPPDGPAATPTDAATPAEVATGEASDASIQAATPATVDAGARSRRSSSRGAASGTSAKHELVEMNLGGSGQ